MRDTTQDYRIINPGMKNGCVQMGPKSRLVTFDENGVSELVDIDELNDITRIPGYTRFVEEGVVPTPSGASGSDSETDTGTPDAEAPLADAVAAKSETPPADTETPAVTEVAQASATPLDGESPALPTLLPTLGAPAPRRRRSARTP